MHKAMEELPKTRGNHRMPLCFVFPLKFYNYYGVYVYDHSTCKASGKLFTGYKRLKSTKDFSDSNGFC